MTNYTLKNVLRITLVLLAHSLSVAGQSQKINEYKQMVMRNTRIPDSTIYYGNLLLKMDDSLAKTEGYIAKGRAMRQMRLPDSSLYYYEKAKVAAHRGNLDINGRILQGIASGNNLLKNSKKALDYAAQLEELAIETGNNRMLAGALSTSAGAYNDLGNYEKSVEKSIEVARLEQSFTPNNLSNTYSRIASTYIQMQRSDMALKWFHKALNNSRKESNPRFENMALSNLARLHFQDKQQDSSRFYATQLVDRVNQLTPFAQKVIYLQMANIESEAGEIDEAFDYLNLAKNVSVRGQSPGISIGVLRVEQQLLRKKGYYDQAELVIDSIMHMDGNLITARNYPILLEKVGLYQEQGKYKEALAAYSHYTRVKDSLMDTNDLAIIQRSANEYDLENKEIAFQEAMEKNAMSRTTIIVLIAISLLIIAILILVYLRYQKSKSRTIALEKQNEAIKASFEKLQHQLMQSKKAEPQASILVNSNQVVKLNHLEYVKSDGHYLDYFVQNEKLPITERKTLKERISELEISGFLQVHRSFVINIDKVKSIQSGLVVMNTGDKIPLSRTYKQRLREEQHPLFT